MNCHICSQILGEEDNDLLARLLGGPYARSAVLETADFVAFPSIGALNPGHVIVCPRVHSRRLADLSAKEMVGFESIRRAMRADLERVFGGVVHQFEHGSNRSGTRVPCTVEHAHLHMIPVDRRISISLPESLIWSQVVGPFADLETAVGESEYLYYETPDGRAWAAVASIDKIESQLLRRTFAEALGSGGTWNWRDHPRANVVRETLDRLTTL